MSGHVWGEKSGRVGETIGGGGGGKGVRSRRCIRRRVHV